MQGARETAERPPRSRYRPASQCVPGAAGDSGWREFGGLGSAGAAGFRGRRADPDWGADGRRGVCPASSFGPQFLKAHRGCRSRLGCALVGSLFPFAALFVPDRPPAFPCGAGLPPACPDRIKWPWGVVLFGTCRLSLRWTQVMGRGPCRGGVVGLGGGLTGGLDPSAATAGTVALVPVAISPRLFCPSRYELGGFAQLAAVGWRSDCCAAGRVTYSRSRAVAQESCVISRRAASSDGA